MGLFDFLKRPARPEPLDPEHLRTVLFQAVAANDERTLEQLGRAHRRAVLELFPSWQTMPEALRNDPRAAEQYVQGLIGVARFFADRLHESAPLERLMGTPDSNPLAQWRNKLTRARELMNDLHYAEAVEILSDLLIDARQLEGSGVEHYLPPTLGHLGECYFQQGQAARAVPPFEQALQHCEQSGDGEGVIAYLGSLYETHRYLGQGEAAAGCAARLADTLQAREKEVEAALYRSQAEIVRAGEPLNRVVVMVNDRQYELKDVPTGGEIRVQFAFQRNRLSLKPAQVHTGRGRQLGSEGKFDAALEAFREAARADAFDPQPHYEAGLTLLYLQRHAEAVESYEATEERAPGWFRARSDLWLAQQLLLGRVEQPLFLALRQIEDGKGMPADKLRLADQALAANPDVPPLYLARGKLLVLLGRREEADATYRQGLERAEEANVRTRLLTELGAILPQGAERTSLLRQAVELNGDLVAAAMAFLALKLAEVSET